MSDAKFKRPKEQAYQDACDLRGLFHAEHFSRWEFGGSLRRGVSFVGDVEHVVIANSIEVNIDGGLFGQTQAVNGMCHHLDRLVADKLLAKHLYGTTGYRWGEKYRGVDFRGFTHEFFLCTESNWGPTLAIRTGPAEFSQRLVVGLLKNGMRQHEGMVWRCDRCEVCSGDRSTACSDCNSTGLTPREVIPCSTEQSYFELCGIKMIPPQARQSVPPAKS